MLLIHDVFNRKILSPPPKLLFEVILSRSTYVVTQEIFIKFLQSTATHTRTVPDCSAKENFSPSLKLRPKALIQPYPSKTQILASLTFIGYTKWGGLYREDEVHAAAGALTVAFEVGGLIKT